MSMKQTGATIFGLLLCAGLAFGAANDLAARLAAPQGRVRFDQADLSDALAITAESVHASAVADWGVLQAAGIKQNTPISMNFVNVSAATTFDVICRLVGGGASWYVDDGVIRLTTQAELDKQGAIKGYWPAGMGGQASDRAAKMADILREYVSGLGDSAIRISNGELFIRGNENTQARVERVMVLCTRPMMASEWRQLLGVEKDLDDSRALMSVSWQGVGVAECLSQLSTQTKIPMVLDGSSDPAQPITLEIKNAAPRQIMNGLLRAASGQSSKPDDWTCEPIAGGQVLWVGPGSRASYCCASFLVGPMAMRVLSINSPSEAPAALCSAVAGCDPDHVRWIEGMHILCREKMDQLLAIGKILGDPSFEAALRPSQLDHGAAARN